MAVLTIRNVPEEVRARLRLRAAKAGRSVEAEARAILAAASSRDEEGTPASALQEWVDRLYGKRKPRRVVDNLIANRRKEAKSE
jgi:plasmid stability protein